MTGFCFGLFGGYDRRLKVGVRHAGGMPQGNLSDYKLVCSMKVSGLQHAG